MQITEYTRENGMKTNAMEEGMKNIPTIICMKENSSMEKLMVRENTYGRMLMNSMKESGLRV